MLQLLYSMGKNPQYPMNRRLGKPLSQSGHFGGQKNLSHLPRFKLQIIQPIT
jgi:hypothetical protein